MGGLRPIFLDVNFLRHSVAATVGRPIKEVRINPHGLAKLVLGRDYPTQHVFSDKEFRDRIYWYDGELQVGDSDAEIQRKYLDEVRLTPGIRLRLGRAIKRNGQLQQKGVDTLIVLDIVRLAQERAYERGFLIAGDADLAEAVRAAQDFGVSVGLLVPDLSRVSDSLLEIVDAADTIDVEKVQDHLLIDPSD